ncbi:hypothetical protein T492DRAFT_974769 [Pavlovales sp. CCMP2436]|nr:hypothetical protein T492DRAFT_974769 [Pavlovales sp. CCMP2436]
MPVIVAATLAFFALCPASRLIESRGVAPAPPGLGALAATLRLQPGARALQPDERLGLHPLMVPLSASAEGEISGVLLVPGATRNELARFAPVVTAGQGLRVLGETVTQAARRLLAEGDVSGAEGVEAAIEAAAADGVLYRRGEATVPAGKAGAQAGLAAYLLPKVGPFLDLYERLAQQHLERGDGESALITCERAQNAFAELGLPFAVHAGIHRMLGREDEARDISRVALTKPLWSLGAYGKPEQLAALAAMAGYEPPRPSREWYSAVLALDVGGDVRSRATELGLPSQGLKESDFILALPFLAPDTYSWDAVREELAATLEAEGRPEVARWITSS